MTGPQLPSPEHATTLDADLRMTLDEYAALPWDYVLRRNEDGWEVRIDELRDFAYYSRELDDLNDLPDALRSHLKAYIATGKPIPVPQCMRAAESRLRSRITALELENAELDAQSRTMALREGFMTAVEEYGIERNLAALIQLAVERYP